MVNHLEFGWLKERMTPLEKKKDKPVFPITFN